MNVSMYQAAAALNANSRWQEIISENLASSSVPGYKGQQLTQAAIKAGLMPAGSLSSTSPQFFTMPKANTATSFAAGDLQYTGNNNNVAIDGKGFFQVRMTNGTIANTRDGEFQVSSTGQLVTKEGFTVMGEAGPIQLDPSNPAPLSISATGDVSQGTQPVGKLKVVEFDKPQLLTQVSGGYFLANNPQIKTLPSTSTIRDGYLEASNTSVVREMANMMTAMRGFEANQHVIQMQDDRMGKVITDLGSTS
jgi:flagellar basal-body rod protein FlgG